MSCEKKKPCTTAKDLENFAKYLNIDIFEIKNQLRDLHQHVCGEPDTATPKRASSISRYINVLGCGGECATGDDLEKFADYLGVDIELIKSQIEAIKGCSQCDNASNFNALEGAYTGDQPTASFLSDYPSSGLGAGVPYYEYFETAGNIPPSGPQGPPSNLYITRNGVLEHAIVFMAINGIVPTNETIQIFSDEECTTLHPSWNINKSGDNVFILDSTLWTAEIGEIIATPVSGQEASASPVFSQNPIYLKHEIHGYKYFNGCNHNILGSKVYKFSVGLFGDYTLSPTGPLVFQDTTYNP